MSRNVAAGLVVLVASGIATWLFLPLASAPFAAAALKPSTTIVSIGPVQVDLVLIVVLVAAGTPFAAVIMAVLVRFLSSLVPLDVSTAAPVAQPPPRKAAPARASQTADEEDIPFLQKLPWLALIVVALGALVLLLVQFLPPGFTLF